MHEIIGRVPGAAGLELSVRLNVCLGWIELDNLIDTLVCGKIEIVLLGDLRSEEAVEANQFNS